MIGSYGSFAPSMPAFGSCAGCGSKSGAYGLEAYNLPAVTGSGYYMEPPPHWLQWRRKRYLQALFALGTGASIGSGAQADLGKASNYWNYIKKFGKVPPPPLGPTVSRSLSREAAQEAAAAAAAADAAGDQEALEVAGAALAASEWTLMDYLLYGGLALGVAYAAKKLLVG